MCWKLCWFNYRPTFGASINALLLATRAHTALTKMNRLQSNHKYYETGLGSRIRDVCSPKSGQKYQGPPIVVRYMFVWNCSSS